MDSNSSQIAPSDLEIVRAFLNTWRIPNDTRVATDSFATPTGLADFQQRYFPTALTPVDQVLTKALRADLRDSLGTAASAPLNAWLARLPITTQIEHEADGALTVRYQATDGTLGGMIMALVVAAIAADEWGRLKACRDCQWVFFDHTKNGSKVWCGMNAGGPEGRACGTIAKVKRWRARQKTQA